MLPQKTCHCGATFEPRKGKVNCSPECGVVYSIVKRTCKCGVVFECKYNSSRSNCSAKCRGVKTRTRSDAGVRKTVWVSKTCPCGKVFEVPRWGTDPKKGKSFCSDPCRGKYKKPSLGRVSKKDPSLPPPPIRKVGAQRNPSDRIIDEWGYAYVWVDLADRCPGSEKNARQAEHRVVMSRILERSLYSGENVHHINGVRGDNRPENLELWVTKQPRGQRARDLVAWAREILDLYADLPEGV